MSDELKRDFRSGGPFTDIARRLNSIEAAIAILRAKRVTPLDYFTRLFGVGVPLSTYRFTNRLFGQNNFAGHIAEFNDSQSSPYSFGASPGGFGWTLPAGSFFADSTFYSSFLRMYNFHANPLILTWHDPVGFAYGKLFLQVAPNVATTDRYIGEFRVWDVEVPGAADEYYAARFMWNATLKSVTVSHWYGTGITFGATDGSEAVTSVAISGVNRIQLAVTATPACNISVTPAESPSGLGLYRAPGAGWPAIIRSGWLYLVNSGYHAYYVDRIQFTNSG